MLCFPSFFYLFPHSIKICFSLLSVPVLSWESINHLKLVPPRMNFFHFCSHSPDSSPWTPMENVDMQRTGAVLSPGSPRCVFVCVCVCVCARARAQSCLTVTPWTVTRQYSCLSMECSRQEYWSGLSFPPPEDLPDTRWTLSLQHWQADSLPLSH